MNPNYIYEVIFKLYGVFVTQCDLSYTYDN
jgi:hypothetical protein